MQTCLVSALFQNEAFHRLKSYWCPARFLARARSLARVRIIMGKKRERLGKPPDGASKRHCHERISDESIREKMMEVSSKWSRLHYNYYCAHTSSAIVDIASAGSAEDLLTF
jgi:hypothetical protein